MKHLENYKENKKNLDSYSDKINPEYERTDTANKIFDKVKNTNWSRESEYHNTVRINGKNTTRTLKLNKTK